MEARRFLKTGLAVVLVLGLVGAVFAQGNKDTKTYSTMKEVQGEVTWVRKDKIAIVYKKDVEYGSEEEILLPIDKDIRLAHLKSISDVAAGDMVYIQFEELTEEGVDGPKLSRTAKKISFIKKGTKKPIPTVTTEPPLEKPEEESQILRSQ